MEATTAAATSAAATTAAATTGAATSEEAGAVEEKESDERGPWMQIIHERGKRRVRFCRCVFWTAVIWVISLNVSLPFLLSPFYM